MQKLTHILYISADNNITIDSLKTEYHATRYSLYVHSVRIANH